MLCPKATLFVHPLPPQPKIKNDNIHYNYIIKLFSKIANAHLVFSLSYSVFSMILLFFLLKKTVFE